MFTVKKKIENSDAQKTKNSMYLSRLFYSHCVFYVNVIILCVCAMCTYICTFKMYKQLKIFM